MVWAHSVEEDGQRSGAQLIAPLVAFRGHTGGRQQGQRHHPDGIDLPPAAADHLGEVFRSSRGTLVNGMNTGR
ncbi:hypothetical protein [Nonomuraea pusilla]|uniref:hypothetical protein n=1 Tax=Nonomuraea pusilla TaxID=46177 RepID=UPI0011603590|nr:hypothetical protein [Nonomuraea pusilla]